MDDTAITVVGFVAAFGTTAAYVPQVIKSWRTSSVHDLSIWLLLLLAAGVALWVVYGVFRHEAAIIVANVLTFFLVGSLLFLKLRDIARHRRQMAKAD